MLGTLRADGSPRLTGLEVHFGEGELWLAMMPDSRKADDLRRDPRFSVHSAPDVSMVDGDAKVGGRAIAEHDETIRGRFAATLPQERAAERHGAVPGRSHRGLARPGRG